MAERLPARSIPTSQTSRFPFYEEEQVAGQRGKLNGFSSTSISSREAEAFQLWAEMAM